jgi:prolipoprotein diacylglyceryltransferase
MKPVEIGIARAAERALRPTVTMGGRAVSSFQVWGVSGFVAAAAVGQLLGARLGLSLILLGVAAAAAAATFLALVLVVRAILGEERLVYYHHEVAVLAVSGLLVAACGRPPLPYLDVAALSLGVFLAFGRIGCWMVGCCHGRPHRLGLRYREEHARAGFSPALVGAPLLPVQAIESALVLALTAVAAWRIPGRPPGATLATQTVVYALVRFLLELVRGDSARPSLWSLSEAQWMSVALATGVVAAERLGWLPTSAWHGTAAGALALAAVAVALARGGRGSSWPLLAPRHVEEVAAALAGPSAPAGPPRVCTTSLGLRVSTGHIDDAGERFQLYTLSGVDRRLADAASSLILALRGASRAGSRLIQRKPDLFHFLVALRDPTSDAKREN